MTDHINFSDKLNYCYFDIETTGFDPKTDKIISIQTAIVDTQGNIITPLDIRADWRANTEKDLIEYAHKLLIVKNQWHMIPLGYNLPFDLNFIKEKFEQYGYQFSTKALFNRPHIDLHVFGIMINHGEFKGSGLDKISNKLGDGKQVLDFYHAQDWEAIDEYIENEFNAFMELYKRLLKVCEKEGVKK